MLDLGNSRNNGSSTNLDFWLKHLEEWSCEVRRYNGKMEKTILKGEDESTDGYIGLIKDVATCLEM